MPGDTKPLRVKAGERVTLTVPFKGGFPPELNLQIQLTGPNGRNLGTAGVPAADPNAVPMSLDVPNDAPPGVYKPTRLWTGSRPGFPWEMEDLAITADFIEDNTVIVEAGTPLPPRPKVPELGDPD